MANQDEKQTVVVLTVHGKDGFSPVIYFSYFNTLEDAHRHCKIINTLDIKKHEWIYARIVKDSRKYQLAEPAEYNFNVLKVLHDDDIRKIREYINYELHHDNYMFLQALKGADNEIQERFFEDSFINPFEPEDYQDREFKTPGDFKSYLESMDISPSNVKDAQNYILEIVKELETRGELLFPLVKADED